MQIRLIFDPLPLAYANAVFPRHADVIVTHFKLVLFACISAICAAPPHTHDEHERDHEHEKEVAHIVKSETNKRNDGSYDVQYEGSDGTQRQEEATVVDAGTDEQALEVKGSYKYINDDGSEVEVFYTAGKNGFVPYGSVINAEISAVAENAKNLPKFEELPLKKH